jgi:hypothetical protein
MLWQYACTCAEGSAVRHGGARTGDTSESGDRQARETRDVKEEGEEVIGPRKIERLP